MPESNLVKFLPDIFVINGKANNTKLIRKYNSILDLMQIVLYKGSDSA